MPAPMQVARYFILGDVDTGGVSRGGVFSPMARRLRHLCGSSSRKNQIATARILIATQVGKPWGEQERSQAEAAGEAVKRS